MQIEEEREPQRGDEEDTVENSVTPQSEFEKPFIEGPDLDKNTFSNLLNDLFQAPSDKVGLIISLEDGYIATVQQALMRLDLCKYIIKVSSLYLKWGHETSNAHLTPTAQEIIPEEKFSAFRKWLKVHSPLSDSFAELDVHTIHSGWEAVQGD